jgi:ABC-type multidrug transport system ATPase subunit
MHKSGIVYAILSMLLTNLVDPVFSLYHEIISYFQDDVLYESLTVYETLYYAAMLRLPREMTKAQKQERVAKVITALGLKKCQNTIIGEACFPTSCKLRLLQFS